MILSHKDGQLEMLISMINDKYSEDLPTPLTTETTSIESVGKNGNYDILRVTIKNNPAYEDGSVDMTVTKFDMSSIPDQLMKFKIGIKKTTKINKSLFINFLNRRFNAKFITNDLEDIDIKSAEELIEKGQIQLKFSDSCLCYKGTLDLSIVENK